MSDRPTEHLLILGGSSDQLYLQRIAREMGLGVCCVDGNPDAPGLASADHSAPIDFSDSAAVVRWVRSLVSSGVAVFGCTSMGTDHPEAVLAVSDAFGWSAPTANTCRLARDKYEMMLAWKNAGVPVPRFDVASSRDDVLSLWRTWQADGIVLKPTLSSGSRGVSILRGQPVSAKAVSAAFDRAAAHPGHVLVEEYLPGPQLSTESVFYHGERVVFIVGDRNYSDAESWLPQTMENGGWMPCSLHPGQVREVQRATDAAAAALGIIDGPAKGDVVWVPGRGPVMVEMGARLSGGDLASAMVPRSMGLDYVRSVIEIAIGRRPTIPAQTLHRTVANRYLFSPPGRLDAARGFDDIASWPGIVKLELWCKQGDDLQPIDSHARRRGVFIVEGSSRQEVQAIIDSAYGKLELAIDGTWWKCHPGLRSQWIR